MILLGPPRGLGRLPEVGTRTVYGPQAPFDRLILGEVQVHSPASRWSTYG
jgi:hypothetical protein